MASSRGNLAARSLLARFLGLLPEHWNTQLAATDPAKAPRPLLETYLAEFGTMGSNFAVTPADLAMLQQ